MGSALADAGLQTDGLTRAARAAWAGESGEAGPAEVRLGGTGYDEPGFAGPAAARSGA
jgi:hypothetical protein